jgi:hypothetical protein
MRSGLSDRGEASEKKFQHDEHLNFTIKARRNRLFGYWAGQEMGLEDTALKAYAISLVAFLIENADDQSLIEKVLEYFLQAGVTYTHHQLEKQLQYFQDNARHEVCKKSR